MKRKHCYPPTRNDAPETRRMGKGLKRSLQWYRERRRIVVQLRVLGNLTWADIAKQIEGHGFPAITPERAYRDYEAFIKEAEQALDLVERKSEVIAKLQGVFTLALSAYQKAEDAQGKAALLQRIIEIIDRLGIVSGLNIAPKQGINLSQVTNVQQQQSSFEELVRKHREARGLSYRPRE